MNDTERMIILNTAVDVGSVRAKNLLKRFGSLDNIFKAGKKELAGAEGVGGKIAENIIKAIKETDLRKEMSLVKKHKARVITFLDPEYPENLRNIYDPPMALYVKGDFIARDNMSVGVVGSRRASFYGLEMSEKLGFELASSGVSVVSGLARGVDGMAHKGALKAKGRTIAILGSGLANIYPEEHIALAEEISHKGVLCSEFPMTTPPDKGNFPRRNRIVSGISLGVVVVEAAKNSGALITARLALEQGRDVFAVPGRTGTVNAKGANSLIKQGAKLVENAQDILDELRLNLSGAPESSTQDLAPELDKPEALVYNLLSEDPTHIDELSVRSRMAVREISAVLLGLEMKKLARQLPGKNFVKY